MTWDEGLRIYRASMTLKVNGFVLADSEEEARQKAIAGLWCFSPVQMPDLETVTAKEEPIERSSGVTPAPK